MHRWLQYKSIQSVYTEVKKVLTQIKVICIYEGRANLKRWTPHISRTPDMTRLSTCCPVFVSCLVHKHQTYIMYKVWQAYEMVQTVSWVMLLIF